jgi:hypothetical protein
MQECALLLQMNMRAINNTHAATMLLLPLHHS